MYVARQLQYDSLTLSVDDNGGQDQKLSSAKNLDSDLLTDDIFFASSNDEEVDDLWALSAATSDICHDDDLLDVAGLEPLSLMKEELHQLEERPRVRQEPVNKLGLTIDTKLNNSSVKGRLMPFESDKKANGSPVSTLPARFALLSTTCVYEPGFTTSPRGKRRISQTHVAQVVETHDEGEGGNGDEGDAGNEDDVVDGDDDEPFMLLRGEDYSLPVFTDAELSAMVESPLPISSTSASSAALSSPHGLAHEETSHVNRILLDATNTSSMSAGVDEADHEYMVDNNMFSNTYEGSQNFPHVQQHTLDPTDSAISNSGVPPCTSSSVHQDIFAADPDLPFNAVPVMPGPTALNGVAGAGVNPFEYVTPSGYAAVANQFMNSNGQQHVQPFYINPHAYFFKGRQPRANAANDGQFASALANSSVMDRMPTSSANYNVPVVPVQHGAGLMPPITQATAASPVKVRLPASGRSKGSRLAITPDIADFKLVQIFHEFCDPTTKVLTLSRFQQLLRHHQIKEDSASNVDAATNVAADISLLFTALDEKHVGSLDLERFMHSFQICNRCTEVKRRAYQALCASQGQVFTPTAIERQLMEDVAPVVVRVVPTHYEGCKVKSCEHYQWTWCEGFETTGNEKCRGTNRHDKCPKYLANCTLWKHKLPPKSRKPRVLLENVDSPTKKIKHFS